MRLFLAVVPPEDVLDNLDLVIAATRRTAGDRLRWSARDTWHITVAFFGEVPDGVVEPLAGALRASLGQLDPYELRLKGAGMFAGRTLWAGVGGQVDVHRSVVDQASGTAAELGLRLDDRERNRAHLTIGRTRPGPRPRGSRKGRDNEAGAAAVQALSVYEGPAWTVQDLWLVRSRPGEGRGGGPLYDRHAQIHLSGRV